MAKLNLLTFQVSCWASRTIWDDCYKVANTRRPNKSSIPYAGLFEEFLYVEDIIMPLEDETGRVNIPFLFVAYITEYDPY